MMRSAVFLLGSAAILSGCVSSGEASAPLFETGYIGPLVPGTYIISDASEVTEIIELLPDGRLQHLTYDRVVIAAGYWMASRNTVCLDLDGDGEGREERCWRGGEPDASGGFVIEQVEGPLRYMAQPVVKEELSRYAPAVEPMQTQEIPDSVPN